MSVEIVTDADSLRAIAPEWRRLALAEGNADVGPDVFFMWLDHYGETDRPFVPVVRRPDGSLHGLLPLVLSTDRKRLLRYAGGRLSLRTHPVAPPGEEHAIRAAAIEEIARHHTEWKAVVFDGVARGNGWQHVLSTTTPRLAAVTTSPDVRYWITLEALTWEGYLRTRSHHFRSRLKSQMRSLREAHTVSFHRVTEEDFDSGLRVLLDLHLTRRLGRGGSSIAAEREQSFFSDFAACALANGWLRLWLMVVDGMPVAASLNCLVGRRYAGYIVGFAREWSRYGVGRLLLSHVIQDAIDEGAREFDLAAGAQEYKARFATHQSEVVNVTLVLSRRPRHLAMVAEGYARQGKDRFIAFSTSARASMRNLVGHRT